MHNMSITPMDLGVWLSIGHFGKAIVELPTLRSSSSAHTGTPPEDMRKVGLLASLPMR